MFEVELWFIYCPVGHVHQYQSKIKLIRQLAKQIKKESQCWLLMLFIKKKRLKNLIFSFSSCYLAYSYVWYLNCFDILCVSFDSNSKLSERNFLIFFCSSPSRNECGWTHGLSFFIDAPIFHRHAIKCITSFSNFDFLVSFHVRLFFSFLIYLFYFKFIDVLLLQFICSRSSCFLRNTLTHIR